MTDTLRTAPHDSEFEIGSLKRLDKERGTIDWQAVRGWITDSAQQSLRADLEILLPREEDGRVNWESLGCRRLAYYLYSLYQAHANIFTALDDALFDPGTTDRITSRPIRAESIVYLCIRQEHERLGKSGGELDMDAARDMAAFAVNSNAIDIQGLPKPKERAFWGDPAHDLTVLKTKLTQMGRISFSSLFEEFPFLKGLSPTSSEHEIEHHFPQKEGKEGDKEREPGVKLEDLVRLVGYIRALCSEREKGSFHGFKLQDLNAVDAFLRALENVVAERIGKVITAAGIVTKKTGKKVTTASEGQTVWKKIPGILREKLDKPLAHVEHDLEAVKKHLKALPEAKHGDGGEEAKGRSMLERVGTIGGIILAVKELLDILGILKGNEPKAAPKEDHRNAKDHH